MGQRSCVQCEQKVSAAGCPVLGFQRAGFLTWILTASNFNDLRFHSNANKTVIDTQCTSMLFSRVFAATQPRTVLTALATACKPPRGFHSRRNVFRINTYESSRKCCKQRTYRLAKSFRCNTYEKQGGGEVLWLTRNPIRISVLSDRRESKDLSSHAMKHVCPESARGGGAEGPFSHS